MKDWVLIGLGLASVAGLVVLAHGCGRGTPEPQRVSLSAADRQAVEAAATAVAEAAARGDTAVLDAAINAKLPPHELQGLRAALALLKGRPALKFAGAEGRSPGGAVVTLNGAGQSRTWHFDQIGGAWKLSGV